ncbi:MAG: hypothetical protein ACPH52_04370, partial [Candidatus Puniceispirillaceae bacterium]
MMSRLLFVVCANSLSKKKANANLQLPNAIYFIKAGSRMDGSKLATSNNAIVTLNWRSRVWLVRSCAMPVPNTVQVQVAHNVTMAKTN